jgi:hypothetical protein
LDFSGDDAASDQPALDPTLAETKRILTDYIELLKKGPIIAGHTQTSPNLPTRLEGVSGQ